MTTVSRYFRAEWAPDAYITASVYWWRDITDYVEEFTTTHGRSKELDRMEASTATFTLDNSTGDFTPGRSESAFYPDVRPRRPIRAYTILDDNWMHFAAVNPPPGELLNPRFTAAAGSAHAFAIVDSTTAGKRVFKITGTSTPSGTFSFYVGLPVDRVQLSVGDKIEYHANTTMATTGAISLYAMAFETDGTFVLESGGTGSKTGARAGAGVTTTQDGYGQFQVRISGAGASAPVEVTIWDVNARLKNVGTTTVASEASGRFPEFTGFVETIKATMDGNLPRATITATDGSAALLNRSIPSRIRQATKLALTTVPANPLEYAFYWPMSQSEDDRTLLTEIGDLPLAVGSDPTPDMWSFSGDALITHVDGPSAGRLQIAHDGSPYNTYVFSKRPNLAIATDNIVASIWIDSDLFTAPASANPILAFSGYSSTGYWLAYMTLEQSGATRAARVHLYTADSGSTVTTGANLPGDGQPHLLTIATFWDSGSSQMNANYYLDGAYVATTSNLSTARPSSLTNISLVNLRNSLPMTIGLGHMTMFTGNVFGPDVLPALYEAGTEDTDDEVDRLNRIITAAEWPGAASMDTPQSDLLSARWDNLSNAWEEVQLAAEDAGGLAFVGPDGEVTYHNRHRRVGAPRKWRYPEWQDGIQVDTDDARILNYVKAERTTGLFRIAEDTNSQAEYGVRDVLVRRNVVDPDEVQAAADSIVNRYAQDSAYIDTVTLDGNTHNLTNPDPANLHPNPSFEEGTSGWVISSGATSITQSPLAVEESGNYSMEITCNGTAQVAISPVTTIPVNPSTSYTGSAYFRAATAARFCRVRLFWYNSAGVFLSNNDGTSLLDSTTGWTRCSVTASSPSTAAYVTVVLLVASVAGEVHYADSVALTQGSTLYGYAATRKDRTNLILNPSMPNDLAEWEPLLNCTIAHEGSLGRNTSGCLKIIPDGAGTAYVKNVGYLTVTPGRTYTMSGYMFTPGPSRNVALVMRWFDESGTPLGTHTQLSLTTTQGEWVRVGTTDTAPVGAVNLEVNYAISGILSEVHYLDDTLVEESDSPGGYFDGGSPGYAWNGVADRSTSSILRDSELVMFAHGARLTDRVDIVGLPAPVAPDEAIKYHVEGYTFTARPVGSQWTFERTLQLSNAAVVNAWVLESEEDNGILENPACILAY